MTLLYAMKASGGSRRRKEGALRDWHAGQYSFVSVREGLVCQLKMGVCRHWTWKSANGPEGCKVMGLCG